MSASPRFWQKLGLRKQTKSTCSDKQENEFMHSSFSFHNLPTVTNNTDNDNSGNQVKHFSNKGKQHHLLRHSASSVSVLCPQSSNFITEKKTVKRASSKIKSIKQTSMEAQQQERANFSFNRTSLDLSSQQQAKLFTPTPYQQTNSPTKIQPYTDTSIANSKLSPPRIVRTKSNQSSVSVPANSSRLPQPAVANVQTKQLLRSESNSSLASFNAQIVMRKKRSFPKIDQSVTVNNGNSGGEDDENKSSCLTRTSSNGSTSTAEKRRSNSNRQRISTPERRKSSGNTQQQEDEESVIGLLREELEKEKTFSRSLQRQKEAIAKDLDYFCKLADDVADEKEEFKRKYEEEKLQNELLRNIIAEIEPNNGITSDKDDNNDINARLIAAVSHSRADLVDLQQQVVNENHLHKQALESKDNEISKLKTDLQQTQKQIQILRKTMEQLLKADGKTLSDDIHDFNEELTRKQSAYKCI
ncbi:MAG: hypothetical protein EXX96DRAFT_547164 [Benjaminiella poitrasii]|nr:MAG: hypothetical protein EXX96DRAFT_547164 [Benjaminiella poitrasii]